MAKQSPLTIRRALLGALPIERLRRLSDRLNPEWSTRADLTAEIVEQWPVLKVWAEFDDMLHQAETE